MTNTSFEILCNFLGRFGSWFLKSLCLTSGFMFPNQTYYCTLIYRRKKLLNVYSIIEAYIYLVYPIILTKYWNLEHLASFSLFTWICTNKRMPILLCDIHNARVTFQIPVLTIFHTLFWCFYC